MRTQEQHLRCLTLVGEMSHTSKSCTELWSCFCSVEATLGQAEAYTTTRGFGSAGTGGLWPHNESAHSEAQHTISLIWLLMSCRYQNAVLSTALLAVPKIPVLNMLA